MEQQVVDAFLAANDMFRRLAQTAPGMLPAGRKAQIQALKELVRKLSDPLGMKSVTSILEALAAGEWTDEEREELAGLVVGDTGSRLQLVTCNKIGR